MLPSMLPDTNFLRDFWDLDESPLRHPLELSSNAARQYGTRLDRREF